LLELSRIGRESYGLGGTVQHGASTLPESAFGKFVEAEAIEVHLATNFQNMIFDRLPDNLRSDMYAYLDKNSASERKPGMTDEQFYYKTRKNSIGPFKAQEWMLPADKKAEITQALEDQFSKLFTLLGMKNTRTFVSDLIKPISIEPVMKSYIGEISLEEVSDLAD
jgi:hypothetical protein